MTGAAPDVAPPPHHRHAWARATVLLVACISLATLLSVDHVYDALLRLLASVEALVRGHPVLGPIAFVLAAALSAMLAFFSSAVLLPPAVYAWGTVPTLALLWAGWWLGGACTYALGRGLRRPSDEGGVARSSGTLQRLRAYAARVPEEVTFPLALLLQLALPSELPGYLCGYLGVRFRTYAAALAIGELVYAAGAVLLGDGIVGRRVGWLVAFGVVGAASSLYAFRELHRRLARRE
jgi:uncharacterized membrane protein YdjX (TVP38/TMEM64 family)